MGMEISAVGKGYPMPELPGDRPVHTGTPVLQPVEHQSGIQDTSLEKTVSELEKVGLAFDKKLSFRVDTILNQVVVKVIDPHTDKVIKEIPSEELQHLHLKIKEMIGILFDKTV